ncbi:MAG: BrnT family toxin [Methylomonas sp.]
MQDDFFEWDDAKAATNLRIHGVAFPYAVKAFRDLFAHEQDYYYSQNST